MSAVFLDCYIIISILIALADGILAMKSFLKKTPAGRFLGFACVGAAVVDISYLIRIMSDNYLCLSVMSSIYFVTIDLMLICLLAFSVYFTKGRFTKIGKNFIRFCFLYTLFEIIIFSITPFREIAVHYIPRNTVFHFRFFRFFLL